jgi:hypothetical protein
MDKFWSILTMPIGVLLCFGPALLVWIRMEMKDSKSPEGEDGEKKQDR